MLWLFHYNQSDAKNNKLPLDQHGSLLPLFLESKPAPYQYHVTSGDVHVGWHRLLAPGGGAAAGRGASRGPVTELGRHAVEPRVAQGLRPLHALRRPDRHSLATQLLHGSEEEMVKHWIIKMVDSFSLQVLCTHPLCMRVTIVLCTLRAYPCS